MSIDVETVRGAMTTSAPVLPFSTVLVTFSGQTATSGHLPFDHSKKLRSSAVASHHFASAC